MNLDGSNRRELTIDDANASPQSTADGKTIVFVSSRKPARGIWRMDADGSNPRPVAQVPDPGYLAISPDDRTVFFTSSRDGSSSTWQVPIEGGTPTLVVTGFDRAAVSPDGTKLAGIYRTPDRLDLAVATIADRKVVQRFGSVPLTVQGGVVLWSADGKGVLFTASERSNIWLQTLTADKAVKVTNFSDQTIYRADRSRDGRFLVAARGNQVRDAFLITNFR
jgi:Tol biopolymer transport system component